MKLTAVMVLAGLCVASAASAAVPLELVTADITGPRGEPAHWQGIEFAALFAVPVPAADAGDPAPGFLAGLSSTMMLNAHFGAGMEVAYHEWQASDAFKETFSSWIRYQTFNFVELGGTTWNFHALEITGHVKFAVPVGDQVRPWLQLGAGYYGVDPEVKGFSDQQGGLTITASDLKTRSVLGCKARAGIDLVRGGRMTFGLDASYDHLLTKDEFGADFDAFAIGGHLTYTH